MKRNKLLWILGIVALLLIVGGVFAKSQGWIGKEEYTKVAVEVANTKEIVGLVSATGKIYPEAEINISPDVPGEIIELNVEEGDSVVAGQILLKIRPDDYKTAIDRSLSGLSSSKAQKSTAEARLEAAKVQRDNAKSELDRSQRLYNEQLISQQEFARAQLNYENAVAEVNVAQQNVNSAQASINMSSSDVRQARDSYQRTIVRAPQSGIVSELNVEEGERVVGTSQMAGTEMLTIANLKNMECRVEVSEIDIARVELGDTCNIEVDAYYGKTFKGVVTKISNSLGDATSQLSTDQVTNFLVTVNILPESYLELSDKKFPFRPGMSAAVDIIVDKENEKLAVPIQSVIAKTERNYLEMIKDSTANEADDRELQEYIFTVKNGKSHLQPVTSGIQDNESIIIETGIEQGDSVIVAPYSLITDRLDHEEKVTVVEKDKVYE